MSYSGELSRPVAAMVFIMGVIGSAMPMLSPVIVGSLASGYNLSVREAGYELTAMLVGFTSAAFVLSFMLHRIDRRQSFGIGLALMVMASLAILVVTGPVTLAIALFCLGSGGGSVMASALAVHAGRARPDRAFAIQFSLTTGAMILVFPLISLLRENWGWFAVFALMGAAAAIALPFLFRLHPLVASRQVPHTADAPTRKALLPVIAAVTALFLISFANFNIWSFAERIGIGHGLNEQVIGTVMGAAALTGLCAGLLAAWLGMRMGRLVPILGALLSLLVAGWLMLKGETGGFQIGVLGFYASWLFISPYLLGTVAALDPAGRTVALGSALQNVGMSVAPAIAGLLITGSDYLPLIWIATICYLIIAFLLAFVARWISRGTAPG